MQKLQKINLSNLKKCNQIWDDMPDSEKGRICQKCQHTIIDFRDLSNSEVAAIHTFTPGKVCGLYNKDQLKITKRTPVQLKFQSAIAGMNLEEYKARF